MARKTEVIRTSDKSGAKIGEGTGGTVRLRDAAGIVYRADVTSAEFRALVKDLNAEKVGGKREQRRLERAAAAAAAEEPAEPGDGEGGEDGDEEGDEESPTEEPAEEKAAA